MTNEFKTSDIKVNREADGCYSATHRFQGDLIVSMIYDSRTEARRDAVEVLKEIKELTV